MVPFINVFGHQISMYALSIMGGLAIGILVAVFRSDIFNYEKEDVFYASLYGIVGIIVGGKILYLLTIAPGIVKNFKAITTDMNIIMDLLRGGFVFYGGLFGAVAGIIIYAKQFHLSAKKLIEIIIPAVPIVHAFGRIGCFCAGCCYGIPIEPPFGVYFTHSIAAPHDVAFLPVQLIEALCNLILFLIMFLRFRKKQTQGEALCFYLFAYGIIRFILEFYRYDAERGFLLGVSTSQWISIGIVVFALFYKKYLKKYRQEE